MDIPNKFSSVMLYHKMKEKNLSAKGLSKLSGINHRQIYRYIRGEQHPRKGVIQRLASALDVPAIHFDASHETDSLRLSFNRRQSNLSNKKYKNIKAIFFDLDGTLAKPPVENKTSWELVWEHLGLSVKLCRQYHGEFNRKEIDHEEWCAITAEHFKEAKLNEASFKEIAKKAPLIEDVESTLHKLHNTGIKLGLLSGSINSYWKEVMPERTRDLFGSEVYINVFTYNRQDGYIESITGAEYDFDGKADRLKEFSEEHNIPMEQIMFVGNSSNDEAAAKTDVISVALNPNRVDPATFKEVFEFEKSLSVILDLIDLESAGIGSDLNAA